MVLKLLIFIVLLLNGINCEKSTEQINCPRSKLTVNIYNLLIGLTSLFVIAVVSSALTYTLVRKQTFINCCTFKGVNLDLDKKSCSKNNDERDSRENIKTLNQTIKSDSTNEKPHILVKNPSVSSDPTDSQSRFKHKWPHFERSNTIDVCFY